MQSLCFLSKSQLHSLRRLKHKDILRSALSFLLRSFSSLDISSPVPLLEEWLDFDDLPDTVDFISISFSDFLLSRFRSSLSLDSLLFSEGGYSSPE